MQAKQHMVLQAVSEYSRICCFSPQRVDRHMHTINRDLSKVKIIILGQCRKKVCIGKANTCHRMQSCSAKNVSLSTIPLDTTLKYNFGVINIKHIPSNKQIIPQHCLTDIKCFGLQTGIDFKWTKMYLLNYKPSIKISIIH